MRQVVLRPHDVAVALELALRPEEGFVPLADAVGVSLSEAHGAVKRLTQAGLLSQERRRVVPSALLDFIASGIPRAFPASVGAETRGVPTATSGPSLAMEFPKAQRYVWPSSEGHARGQSLTPLYPKATKVGVRRDDLYTLLTLVDAVRVGQARERERARELIGERLIRANPERPA
ncbi:MAG: hypothetical protein SGJ01_10295 [Gemmatimonadota bacterium]|nr:hypothetical protein [Gemmatimonadota bacterium]MDZ4863822.1 hypothetical protein [Gemmatimonadota bacterium]